MNYKLIISIFTVIGMIVAGIGYLDHKFASAESIKDVMQSIHIGLVADWLPDERMLEYNKDGTIENFEDRAIIATMINAIKELKSEIDELKMKCGN